MKKVFALLLAGIMTVTALSFFGLPLHSLYAQLSSTPDESLPSQIPDVQEEVDLTVSPQNPQPNDTVTITLEAPGTNLDKANIVWKRNGKVQLSGVGAKTFIFNAGPLGTASNIVVDFTPFNGPTVEKTVQISAQSVDILWEANSYRPPFYQGKSMYTPEGEVAFMAMPNLVDASGKSIDPSSLVYNWSIDDKAYADMSGFGRNSYVFDGDILAQQTYVSVQVSTLKGDVTGEGSLLISPTGVGVLAYENNPTYGVLFNKAITEGYNLKQSEIDLSAYPYNVSTQTRDDPNLQYSWSINSSPINSPQTQNEMVFRNSDNTSGSSLISLSLQDADKIRQSASL